MLPPLQYAKSQVILNSCTIKGAYILSWNDGNINTFIGTKYFFEFGLSSGIIEVLIEKRENGKTAFTIRNTIL